MKKVIVLFLLFFIFICMPAQASIVKVSDSEHHYKIFNGEFWWNDNSWGKQTVDVLGDKAYNLSSFIPSWSDIYINCEYEATDLQTAFAYYFMHSGYIVREKFINDDYGIGLIKQNYWVVDIFSHVYINYWNYNINSNIFQCIEGTQSLECLIIFDAEFNKRSISSVPLPNSIYFLISGFVTMVACKKKV